MEVLKIYIEAAFRYYVALWLAACAVAAYLVARSYRSYSFLRQDYLRFILMPWKATTAVIAISLMALVSPYTGDPTWDYCDSIGMGLLTYLGAPWAVGTIYRTIRRKASLEQAYVAICLTMFTASWSYDGYILLRDGFYPTSWFYNIPLSLTLYTSGGLLWSLSQNSETRSIFAFQDEDWLKFEKGQGFAKVAWFAMLFMLFVVVLVGLFVRDGALGR